MADKAGVYRLSPLWLGTGIAVSLVALLIISETALGRWDLLHVDENFDLLAREDTGVLRDLRIAVVHCLLAAYFPAALLHLLQNGQRTVARLQGVLNCTPGECDALARSVRLSRRGLFVATLVGLLIAFVPPFFVEPVPESPWDPATWSPEVFWHRVLGPVVGIGLAWLAYAIATVSLRMSHVARRLSNIDLLNLAPVAPFVQQGLTHALLLAGLLSIVSLMLLETGFKVLMIFIGGGTLVLATLALVAPVRGVQTRVHAAKQEELAWISDRISGLRAAFGNSQAGNQSGELADMIAYRTLIENIPEWTFTSSTYARLLVYALIPLASWGAGIVAEEVIGRLFF